jgi:glycosyltransferase involved in cell wall biosynthesis
MNVALVNTYDPPGGAASACHSLHRALLKAGAEGVLIVKAKRGDDNSVICVSPGGPDVRQQEYLSMISLVQSRHIDQNRTDLSNSLFTLPYPGYDLSLLSAVRRADIINLHWLTGFQSPKSIGRLLSLGKPVVWTLHDMRPFTGGCHYSAGCDGYRSDCAICPQLNDDPFRLAEAILKDELELLKDSNITIVSPSRWLANCARQSSLFGGFRVEAIPNGIDTEMFSLPRKRAAKRLMGIDDGSVVVLFGAEKLTEIRKGTKELFEALRYCMRDGEFRTLVDSNAVTFMAFGSQGAEFREAAVPWTQLGYIDSPEQMRLAYAASDLYILPSLEDNLPTTVLEAMSCGTPVVAFRMGGAPDMIEDGVTGRLVESYSVTKLGEAIAQLVRDPETLAAMGQESRKVVEQAFSLEIQACRYLGLFDELLKERQSGQGPETRSGDVLGDAGTCYASTVSLGTEMGPSVQRAVLNIVVRDLLEKMEELRRLREKEETFVKRSEKLQQFLLDRFAEDNVMRRVMSTGLWGRLLTLAVWAYSSIPAPLREILKRLRKASWK